MTSEKSDWYHIAPLELGSTSLKRLTEHAYPRFVAALSHKMTQTQKASDRDSLMVLDRFRLVTIAERMTDAAKSTKGSSKTLLDKKDIQKLVEWKTLRGVYRPSLQGLIASNSEANVKQTMTEAYECFADAGGESTALMERIPKCIKILCKLRGVGPATASLILSTLFPMEVPFFSDELFAWVKTTSSKQVADLVQKVSSFPTKNIEINVRIDKVVGIKYTDKEYKELLESMLYLKTKLSQRGTEPTAADLDKVAFVAIRGFQAPEVLALDSVDISARFGGERGESSVVRFPAQSTNAVEVKKQTIKESTAVSTTGKSVASQHRAARVEKEPSIRTRRSKRLAKQAGDDDSEEVPATNKRKRAD